MIRKSNKNYLDDMTFNDGVIILFKIVDFFKDNKRIENYEKSYTVGITIKNVKLEEKIELHKNEMQGDHFIFINHRIPLDFEKERFICFYQDKYYTLKKVNNSSMSLLLTLNRMEAPDEKAFITP